MGCWGSSQEGKGPLSTVFSRACLRQTPGLAGTCWGPSVTCDKCTGSCCAGLYTSSCGGRPCPEYSLPEAPYLSIVTVRWLCPHRTATAWLSRTVVSGTFLPGDGLREQWSPPTADAARGEEDTCLVHATAGSYSLGCQVIRNHSLSAQTPAGGRAPEASMLVDRYRSVWPGLCPSSFLPWIKALHGLSLPKSRLYRLCLRMQSHSDVLQAGAPTCEFWGATVQPTGTSGLQLSPQLGGLLDSTSLLSGSPGSPIWFLSSESLL